MRNTVHHIDCLMGMQDIPDKSIDMILCDLPYGTTACKWDVIIPFEPLWKQYERIIKDNGAIVLTASQPFTSMLVMSNLKLFKYCLIWDKIVNGNFQLANIQPLKIHEDIAVFSLGKTTYNKQCFNAKNYKRKGSTKSVHFNSKTNFDYDSSIRNPLSIIQFPRDSIIGSNEQRKINCLHPTQKPVALFEYLIKTYTNEGETVLDNCAGSGTTAIACMNTNRSYILMEKEEKYYNIILDRIKKHTPQLKLIA